MGTFKEHNSAHDREIVHAGNLEELTGYGPEEFAKLTGIYGVAPSTLEIAISGRYPAIQVIVRSDKVDMERLVNIEHMTIHNEVMKSISKEGGLAWRLLKHQIAAAKGIGIKSITLDAARGKGRDGTIYEGYNIWHKMGFLLDDDSKPAFLKRMSELNRKETTPQEICSTEEGAKVWKEGGITWGGELELRDGSEGMEIWTAYLSRKEQEQKKPGKNQA